MRLGPTLFFGVIFFFFFFFFWRALMIEVRCPSFFVCLLRCLFVGLFVCLFVFSDVLACTMLKLGERVELGPT